MLMKHSKAFLAIRVEASPAASVIPLSPIAAAAVAIVDAAASEAAASALAAAAAASHFSPSTSGMHRPDEKF